jgi:hypothetical protein
MKKKIKGKKIFKNGATGGYIYDVKRKKWIWRILSGPQKGYGKTPSGRSEKSSRPQRRLHKYGEVAKKKTTIYPLIKMTQYGEEKNNSLFANENSEFLYNKNNINDYKITYSNGKIRKQNDLSKLEQTRYIYVMDTYGNIYVDTPLMDVFHHSSFFSGEPVSAAGSFYINNEGDIIVIDNNSGHYKPPVKTLDYVTRELRKLGYTKTYLVSKYYNGITTSKYKNYILVETDDNVELYDNDKSYENGYYIKKIDLFNANKNPIKLPIEINNTVIRIPLMGWLIITSNSIDDLINKIKEYEPTDNEENNGIRHAIGNFDNGGFDNGGFGM